MATKQLSMFDALFLSIVRTDGWMTHGTLCELCDYLKCDRRHAETIFWSVKNGFSKGYIKGYIHRELGKTTEEFDMEYVWPSSSSPTSVTERSR